MYYRLNNRSRKSAGKNIFLRIFAWVFWATLVLVVMVGITGLLIYQHYTKDLPSVDKLRKYEPPTVSYVYDRDGNIVAEFFKQKRIVVPIEKIPKTLIQAFIAAEDAHFYEHPGIDLMGVARAMIKNIQAGSIVQGGSTITQQVTKSLLLTPERSWSRKFREAILAYRIDNELTKEEILYLYLNQIYLGHGAYGVEAAAQNYFGKHVWELNLPECALLAGLPSAPSRYSPCAHPRKALARRSYVLRRMQELGFVSQEEAREANQVPIDIVNCSDNLSPRLNYFTEEVRRTLLEKFGEDVLYNQGLKIYTTLDSRLQREAERAIDKGLRELDKRQGYCGPEDHMVVYEIEKFLSRLKEIQTPEMLKEGKIVKAIVLGIDQRKKIYRLSIGSWEAELPYSAVKWALLAKPYDFCKWRPPARFPDKLFKKGDVILVKLGTRVSDTKKKCSVWTVSLEQDPVVQGALVCMENETGYVRALVGGRSFAKSQFNRATQALRQPGSAFKPIIYSAALDNGFNPLSVIVDAPIGFPDPSLKGYWKPQNYGKRFYGPTYFREALIHSRNIVTIKILISIGVNKAIEYARNLGITAPLTPTLSLALGASGVSLMEMTSAYSAFANLGQRVKPIMITKVMDRHGEVLFERTPSKEYALSPETAFVINHLLQEVVLYGTGQRVKALNRPAAGKTGTSNNLRDAWFIGYTPKLLTGVWVGFDNERYSLGRKETGAKAASPIWLYFMKEALRDQPINFFPPPPPGVVLLRINPETGTLAGPEDTNVIVEAFKADNLPKPKEQEPEDEQNFFKADVQ